MAPYLAGRQRPRVDPEDVESLEMSEAFNFRARPATRRQRSSHANRCTKKQGKGSGAYEKDDFNGQSHIVLLGDSTLDNARYLDHALGEASIEQQLSMLCKLRGWRCTSAARDGARLEDVLSKQVDQIPQSATHLVLSASGNDLLGLLNAMNGQGFSAGAIYAGLGDGLRETSTAYRKLISRLDSLGCHIAICTVYRPRFKGFFLKGLANLGLAFHNAKLSEISEEYDCSVIDLAAVLDGEDFANALELNPRGGMKVVENISHFVLDHPASHSQKYQHLCLVGGSTAEDDPVVQTPMHSGIGFTVKCCTSRSRLRRVYATSAVTGDLYHLDKGFPTSSRGSQEPVLFFSQEQQCWREA